MVVMLKQCCCGCTLKTGTLIIAVVFAILAALQLVMYSVAAVDTWERHEHLRAQWEIEQEERLSSTSMPELDEHGRPLPASEAGLPEHGYRSPVPLPARIRVTLIIKWCMILLSITETISFFLNILLMFAANKDSARHVLLWLLGFLATSCSRLLLHFVIVGTIFSIDAIIVGLILFAMLSLMALGAAYSLVVVQSYYRQLVGTGIARRISRQDE